MLASYKGSLRAAGLTCNGVHATLPSAANPLAFRSLPPTCVQRLNTGQRFYKYRHPEPKTMITIRRALRRVTYLMFRWETIICSRAIITSGVLRSRPSM